MRRLETIILSIEHEIEKLMKNINYFRPNLKQFFDEV